jgi:cell division septum initiation protein DivIVA
MTNDKDSAVIKSRLAAVNWELPGMEKFSKDDIAFFKREIGHEKGGIVKNLHSLGWSYWPIANRGYLDHRLLRVIADFIEIQNKPFWDDYEAMNAEEDAFRASQPAQSDATAKAVNIVQKYMRSELERPTQSDVLRGALEQANESEPIITKQMLIDADACSDQVDLFEGIFGDSVAVTIERAEKVAHLFDWDCATRLLDEQGCIEYKRTLAAAQAECDRAIAAAQAEYDRAPAEALRSGLELDDESAFAEYQRVIADARAKYGRVVATSGAKLDRVIATAWATAFIDMHKRGNQGTGGQPELG